MSNVEKGNQFENKSIEIIEKLINEKKLGILKDCIQIFTKKDKKYPSKLKGRGDVEFDLTIEVWAPSAPKYSSIYIIECKNYKGRVPISAVKKFYIDILETHGVNAKGIIITKTPLQRGAYEFAKAQGIMVIEGESKNDYEIVLYKNSHQNASRIPRIEETLDKTLLDKGALSIEKIVDDQILNAFVKSNSSVSFGIDHLSKLDIKQIAEVELNKLDESLLVNANGINKEKLLKYLKTEYGIDLVYFESSEDYIGNCEIDSKVIGIREDIIGTPREMFTLCHELGHFILHSRLRIDQILLDSFSDSEQNFRTGKHDLNNPRHWIEWQANYFSASFLIPETSIKARLWRAMQKRNLKKGRYHLDDTTEKRKKFLRIVELLSDYFSVSKTAIIHRLNEFDLIVNNSRTQSVGQLINDYRKEFFT